MDSDHVLVLFLALVLVGAAGALAYSSPTFVGGESEGIGGASLASFETTDAYCGDPNTTTGSALSHDIRGGEALVLNHSVPVPANDTTVSASLEEFGPHRYVLQITRETPELTPTPTPATETATPTPANNTVTPANDTSTPANDTATPAANPTEDGNGTAGTTATERTTATPTPTPADGGSACHPEIRYNASIHVASPDDYTVVVTYDGEFVAAHWREGDDGGSFDRIPEQPETEAGRNATAAAFASVRRST